MGYASVQLFFVNMQNPRRVLVIKSPRAKTFLVVVVKAI